MYKKRLGHGNFDWHLEKIVADKDAWIETSKLLDAIVSNSRVSVLDEFVEYLRRRLDGDITKPRGRRPGGISSEIRNELIRYHYRRHLDWLTIREKSQGLKGWSQIRDAEWWQGPPSERAARITKELWRQSIGWERVRQIAMTPGILEAGEEHGKK